MNKPTRNNQMQYTQQPFILKTGNNVVPYIVLGVLGIGGFIVGKKLYNDFRLSSENKKADTDNNSNLASQIHAENRAVWTEDSEQVSLFRQITDYNATLKAYKKVSGGKDMLEDTRKHVSSGTYQQILNIIGVKGGAVQATSQTALNVQTQLMQYLWVVAKVDTRIRKSPKVGSAVFTMRPNIIGVAKGNEVVGLIDKTALINNKGKLFYDDENNTFFLPILIFQKPDFKTVFKAFVAIANVNVFKSQPKNSEYFSAYKWQYDQAYSVSGIPKNNPKYIKDEHSEIR